MPNIKENVDLRFSPSFEITESDDTKASWLKIGGLALNEGISRNGNKYTFENLKENDGRNFKWLFGHPGNDVEEHVVGKGRLNLSGKDLLHEGKIRNTARHPDVIQSVKDGFLGPSIHAKARKITEEDGNYLVEGLNIMGVGLVAFQGVKSASIDYAIAESFEMKESSEEDEQKDSTEDKMSEEEVKQPEAAPEVEQPVEEPKAEEPKAEEPKEEPKEEVAVQEELKMLRQKVEAFESVKKTELVESIISLNKDLKKEELMKESEERLNLMKEYEIKLANKVESAGIVEEGEPVAEEFVVDKIGDYSMTKEAYDKFNKELHERVN